MSLMDAVNKTEVGPGRIAVCWLGQAGFLFKTSSGMLITVDPYLSDCVEREFGFKRLSASVIDADELETDILIVSHEHLDHFDIDSMPVLEKNTRIKIICSPAAAKLCEEMCPASLKITALERGREVDISGINYHAVYADHGDLAPDSIGMLIDIDGYKIYYSSDTAFRPEEIAVSLKCEPDLAILPINGMYGNLNGHEAAELAAVINAGKVIPCHFWMFREHNGKYGDPLSFENAMQKKQMEEKIIFLTPGEIKIIEKEVWKV